MKDFEQEPVVVEIPPEQGGLGGYITLKEAARLSGYAPDYVGQLIRKGKLPGKRIYTNAVWVTTKEDVLRYIHTSEQGNAVPAKGHVSRKAKMIVERTFDGKGVMRVFRIALYAALAFSIALAILLFYIFSSALEKKFSDQALRGAALDATSSQAQ